MITEMAIDELNKVLVAFRNEHKESVKTVGEALESMTKQELLDLCAKLILVSNLVVQSRL